MNEVVKMKVFDTPLKGTAKTAVNENNTAKAVKSGSLDVFATPMMIALIEEATCSACAPLLDENETTVGTKINVSHDKPSKLGSKITAYAELNKVDKRQLTFSVYAEDDNGNIIGKGTVERFVVLSDKFMKKVNG